MKKVLFFMFVLVTVAAFAIAGDSSTFLYATTSEPDSFDPHYDYETAGVNVLYQMYDNLVMYKKGSLTEFLPMLSTQVPTKENGLIKEDASGVTYTFPIRKGVKFHNGSDLSPSDVEYTFERALLFDPAGGPIWMYWEAFTAGKYQTAESFTCAKLGVENYNDLFDADGNPKPEYLKGLESIYTDYVDKWITSDSENVYMHLPKYFGPFLSSLVHNTGWGAIIDKETSIKMGLWDQKADDW
jgi:peptide/nickel transport system substrate-binding protein